MCGQDDDLEALIADPRYLHTYSEEIRDRIKDGYETDPRWKTVIPELEAARVEPDPMIAKLPYIVEDYLSRKSEKTEELS
ncbi:hypothetical protein N7501_005777 [Penicillium viridicatum]|nr:hypothetical protein N7501_005777 [Penicillium viridicatum]